MKDGQERMIIVGAGLAGLTAAAYLSRAGYPVLLLEKNSGSGGLLSSFERDGFTFDTGARSIENSGVIRPMLEDLGIDLELLASPVSIGIGSEILDMSTDTCVEDYQHLLERLFPQSHREIRKIFKTISRVMKDMSVIYGFDNPVFREDFTSDRAYIFKELLPWMVHFIPAVMRMNRMDEPIEDFLDSLSPDQSLKDLLDQHFFRRTPMFFALGYFYVYQDYLYPKGGTGRLAEKLSEKILESGGEILYDTEIVSVDPHRHLVYDASGNSLSYDKLVWCGDLKSLYRDMDTSGLEHEQVLKVESEQSRVFASRGGDSVFSLYLGTDLPLEYYERIAHGHLFYTPEQKGLGELFRSELKELISDADTLQKDEVSAWIDRYCRLTTYEISIPSMRDESLSPEGHTGLVVSFLFEYDLVSILEQKGWYEEFKEYIEDRMIEVLDRSIFPGLAEHVTLRISSSPLTIERIFSSSEGGITGWTFERPSPVISDLKKIPRSVETPVPDILQAGQWAYCPAGIPTAILTGWYAADAVKKENDKK